MADDPRRLRLAESAACSTQTCVQLQAIIAIKDRMAMDKPPGRLSHSQPPWNAAAAFSVLSLHQLARDIESRFRAQAGQPQRVRGGSDENTRLALEAAVRLADAVSDSAVVGAIHDLEAWGRRARMILGRQEMPQRLPRLPGKGEPVCPFCKRRTLRMFPVRGIVVCVTPLTHCHDDEGRKPFARVEYFDRGAEWLLRWQDGITGVPVEETAA